MSCVSLLYATAEQAGGTASVSRYGLRGVSCLQNAPHGFPIKRHCRWLRHMTIVLEPHYRSKAAFAPDAFVNGSGLPVLDDPEYFALMGLLLVVAVLMVIKRGADLIQAQSV